MSVDARCRDAAKRLLTFDFVRVHSDDDADGIAAAAVLTRALDRQGIPFHLTMGRMTDEDHAALEAHDQVVLLDQGSGALDRLSRHPGDVVVLDHHVPRGKGKRLLHVNPLLEGESGTSDCCASSLALATALHLDPVNADLALVAMGGIVGDRQHVPRLSGTNAALAQRALNAGALEARRWLPFEPETSLERALATSVDPLLVGLAGNARRTHAFLGSLGLRPETTIAALEPAESRRLASALVARLLGQGAEPRTAEEVAGLRFLGKLAGRAVSAARLSALLNACGRAEKAGMGVALAHGDPDALKAAEGLADAYDETLLKGLLQLTSNPPEAMTAIQWFDAPVPELAGAHCGLGMAYVFTKDKPTLALIEDGDHLKVSGRATAQLVERGVNLADALHAAATEHEGAGGGHPIAAGAKVPLTQREAFLARLDHLVGGQLA